MFATRRCVLALAAALAAGLFASVGHAQTPRIAPPPACRVDGRTSVADLVQRLAPTRTVVAVLPLEARLSSASQAHLPWALGSGFASGIAALPGITTPSRGTTERASADAAGRLDEFAELLGARVIVTGSVTSQRGGAAITVRIRERDADVPRWEREFLYPQTSLASIEEQVVTAVAEVLAVAPGTERTRPVVDPAAYDDIVRGDFFLLQHDASAADSARASYERALERMPRSPEVLAKLARAYATSLERRGRVGPLGELAALREAEALVERALAADSASADAWTARAVLERVRDPRSYGSAVRAHERAVRLAPRNADARQAFAVTLLNLGRDEAADAQLRQAIAVERDRAATLRLLAEIEYLGRRYQNACALVNASIGADPYDPEAYALRARVRMRLDEFRDAFSDAETARRLSSEEWGETLEFYVTAYAREVDAAKSESRRLSQSKLKAGNTLRVRDAAYLGLGLSAIGNRDKAFDALSRARPRGAELRNALRDPGFDQLRADPRFARIGRDEPLPAETGPRRPGDGSASGTR